MKIKNFDDLFQLVKMKPPKVLVIANGIDAHSLEAASEAVDLGLVNVLITGDMAKIETACDLLSVDYKKFSLFHCETPEQATKKAVDLVRDGKAGALMKGLIGTDVFMKAILNKEDGILPMGSLLSHVAVISNPLYPKLLLASDVAIVPLPIYEQKISMTMKLIQVAHQLGIEKPKVAFIAASEQVSEKMPACADAKRLTEYWENGHLGESVCFGPMALDVALDNESAQIKGIQSIVAGDADCLLFPNIESGNVFYKMNTKFCGAETAAIVCGTMVPTVLSSRGDSMKTKLYSIALASLIG
jgi:phosphate butyryltransferase